MRVDGKFNDVLDGIRCAIARRAEEELSYNVNISVITTRHNLAEIPDIIRLSEELDADSVILRPLHDYSISAFRENRHDSRYNDLQPEHLKDYAALVRQVDGAIKKAGVKVISTDPRFSGETFSSIYSGGQCFRPYTTMIFYRSPKGDIVQPCCFMADNPEGENPGYPVLGPGVSVEDVWNSRFYINLRKSFNRRNLISECAKCRNRM